MGLSGTGSFTRWQSRCQPGLQLFQGSFGVESISKLPEVVVESIQFVLYYWTEGLHSSPKASLGSLSLGPLHRTAYSMTAMSEEVRGQESRGKDGRWSLLSNFRSPILSLLLYLIH